MDHPHIKRYPPHMALGDRLRHLDDNAYADFVHDQYAAPFSWWMVTAVGLLALGVGIAKGNGVPVAVGVGLTLIGFVFSVLCRRRDRRLDSTRRERTSSRLDQSRSRGEDE